MTKFCSCDIIIKNRVSRRPDNDFLNCVWFSLLFIEIYVVVASQLKKGGVKMKMKVYSEGNSFIGILPRSAHKTGSRSTLKNPMSDAFKKYYREAQTLNINKRELNDFLFEKMLNDEGSYLLDLDTIKEMVKKEVNRVHQKVKRYRRKMGFFRPNYFLTFTYSDDQTNEEEFELKLRRALSNLAYRNEWRYIGVKERGSEGGRVHFHFLAYIPEGKMVGELFLDSQWSTKRKKREYFTNNTFFVERFGKCRFDKITNADLLSGGVSNYLIKYLIKDDEKLIYSRHIPTEIEVDVDLEKDVFCTFYDFGLKVYLSMNLFYSEEELKALGSDDFYILDPEGLGFDPTVCYTPRNRLHRVS